MASHHHATDARLEQQRSTLNEEPPTWDVLRHLPDVREAQYFDKDGKSTRADGGFLRFSEAHHMERGNRTEDITMAAVMDHLMNSQWYKRMTEDISLLLEIDVEGNAFKNPFASKMENYCKELAKLGREIDRGKALESLGNQATRKGEPKQGLGQALYQGIAASEQEEFNTKVGGVRNVIDEYLEKTLDTMKRIYEYNRDNYFDIYRRAVQEVVDMYKRDQPEKVTKKVFTEQWNRWVAQRGLPLIESK